MRYFDYLCSEGMKDNFFYEPQSFNKNSSREELALALGATLYMPAVRNDISEDIINKKYKELISLVICLEDAIGDNKRQQAYENLRSHFNRIYIAMENNKLSLEDLPLIFLRVKNPKEIMKIYDVLGDNIQIITGFVFPKFNLVSGEAYISELNKINNSLNKNLYCMPILESEDIIYKESRMENLVNLRALLDASKKDVLNVRIGGTDFCSLFGLRRSSQRSIYDICVVRDCISDIINAFTRVSNEYVVSGPVWEYFDINGLINETLLDIENGLTGKTIIHPSHIIPVQATLSVSYEQYLDALDIMNSDKKDIGVVKSSYKNKMNEVRPHSSWANKILLKGKMYGVLKENKGYENILKRVPYLQCIK